MICFTVSISPGRECTACLFIEILLSWSSHSFLLHLACTGLPFCVVIFMSHSILVHGVLCRGTEGVFLSLTHIKKICITNSIIILSFFCTLSLLFIPSHLALSLLFWLVADPGRSVMSARFRLPAGRSYNVRATELERDRQHTQVVCNVLLLDNTVQAFKVSVSTGLNVDKLN